MGRLLHSDEDSSCAETHPPPGVVPEKKLSFTHRYAVVHPEVHAHRVGWQLEEEEEEEDEEGGEESCGEGLSEVLGGKHDDRTKGRKRFRLLCMDYVVLVIIILFGLGLCLTAYFLLLLLEDESTESSFKENTLTAFQYIDQQLKGGERTALALAAMLEVKNDASFQNWNTFVEKSRVSTLTLINVAYHERVSNAQRAAWENSVRTYSPTFTGMWELDDNQVRVSAGTRSEYWAAKFHSPLSDTSLYVYGFDAMSSPVRRAAVEKAIDTGSLAVTPAIMSSVTLESSRVGLYSAVYSTSTVPSTVAARRAAAVGAVLSFITVSNIMDTSSLGISSHIRFYLIDSSVSSGSGLLYASHQPSSTVSSVEDIPSNKGLRASKTVTFADRTYIIVAVPDDSFSGGSTMLLQIVVPVSLGLLSIVLAVAWVVFAIKKNHVEELNRCRAADAGAQLELKKRSEKLLRQERHHLRQEVVHRREAEEAAHRAIRDRSNFFAKMSHEIRTPMHAILALVQILKQDTLLSHTQQDLLATMEDSSELLLSVISDILDFTKAENRMLEFHVQPIDLCSTIQKSVALFSERAAHAHKTLSFSSNSQDILYHDILEQFCVGYISTFDVKGTLLSFDPTPCSAAGTTGEGPSCVVDFRSLQFMMPDHTMHYLLDATKMRQILYNLLSNAVKYSRRSIRLCAVVVELSPFDSVFHMELSDDGRGISLSEHQRIFQSFVQVENQDGTGLGLAVVSEIIKAMHGSIEVRSQKGYGATFVVDLPLKLAVGLQNERSQVCSHACSGGRSRTPWQNTRTESLTGDMVVRSRVLARSRAFSFSGGFSQELLLSGGPPNKADSLLGNRFRMNTARELDAKNSGSGSGRSALSRLQQGSAPLVFEASASSRKPPRNASSGRLPPSSSAFAAAGGPAADTSSPSSDAAAPLPEWRILVVDDNRINQRVLLTMLKSLLREGAVETDVANNGKQALDLFVASVQESHRPYDLILMDCQMPVMDGLEATRAIRKFESEMPGASEDGAKLTTPVVAITANALEEQLAECFIAGMQDVLVKPFNRDQVTGVIATYGNPKMLKGPP